MAEKSYRETIVDGIRAEMEAIAYYTHLVNNAQNGNDRRSFQHALDEENDHLRMLQKKLKKEGLKIKG